MKNVITKLSEINNQINLKQRFDFSFDITDRIFNSKEIEQFSSDKNPFDQNVRLKWILNEKYKSNTEQNFIDFWVINNWGGIRGFKQNERNIEKVRKFKKQLEKKKLSKENFSTISSLSKISSFIDPENFVIYDSRVIYALNWLILTCENQNGFKEEYYPMPNGRNKIITSFDMNTIVNIFHISEYTNNIELYVSEQDAYFKFCDFIKTNVEFVCGKNSKPYELEMLLFILADKEIFTDLKERIKIII